jgi:hypothetical protein
LLGVAFAESCGFGVRSDRRAIAIVTAPASTASPASCPPIRRVSSGTVAAASAACTSARALADGSPSEPVVGVGLAWTVGNRPAGLVAETPVPDIAGSVVPGGKLTTADELGMGVLAETTTSDAVPMNDREPEAVALAEMRTGPPMVAVDRTGRLTCSSAAWPVGRFPTEQVTPLGWGHTVNVGPPT